MSDKTKQVILTKIEKNILNYCRNNNITSHKELTPLFDKYGTEHVCLAFRELYEKKMFSYCAFADNDLPAKFKLSFAGLHWNEKQRINLKSFFLRSIVTPIGISLVTSLLFWLVQYIRWQ